MPTPTGNEDLTGALTTGQSICWDETHGYVMGADMNPDTDCSGFVGYCLSQNGFNVPRRWDTTSMIYTLQNYSGFTEYIYTSSFQWKHGDIAVYDEGGGANGHTFFYVEGVWGYTDSYWRNASAARRGTLSRARMEASGTHDHPETGDQDNGHGAHTEVWIHNFSFDPGAHQWHIFRWQAEPGPIPPPGPGPTPPSERKKFPVWLLNKRFIKGLHM